MENVRVLVQPSKSDWVDLPRRGSEFRSVLAAWLTGVVTIAVAFVVDQGWEEPALSWEESLLPVNVFGAAAAACTAMFVLLGWALGRATAFGLVLILAVSTGLNIAVGHASAPVWVSGALVAVVLAAVEAWASSRQLKAVKQVAARFKDGSTVQVGSNALSAERRSLKRGRGFTVGLAALSIVLWGWLSVQWFIAGNEFPPTDGSSFDPVVAQFAGVATALTVVSAGRNLWRWWAHRQARQTVWMVPCAGGPVWAPGLDPSYGDGIDPKDADAPGCSCRTEAQRRLIDDEEDGPTDKIPAGDYCLIHGIDVVNSLDHNTFRALARTPWFWDRSSVLPSIETDTSDTAAALVAFAGHAFGGIPAQKKGSVMDSASPKVEAAEELRTTDAAVPQWAKPEFPPPHERGVLDIVDLSPAGMRGIATRYRHGRAWHTP
ncbi:hypothetical protein R5O87_21960 [Arthrobacter globiformis]|uniref:hypothetical protein n=1 Tax=Arthrobacter globiformis TaxID=1665 RepID=UPI00397845F5